jgi:hypothetical protein
MMLIIINENGQISIYKSINALEEIIDVPEYNKRKRD